MRYMNNNNNNNNKNNTFLKISVTDHNNGNDTKAKIGDKSKSDKMWIVTFAAELGIVSFILLSCIVIIYRRKCCCCCSKKTTGRPLNDLLLTMILCGHQSRLSCHGKIVSSLVSFLSCISSSAQRIMISSRPLHSMQNP